MSVHEFDIIDQFAQLAAPEANVALGIGDDAAIIDIPADQQLVLSIDTLVENIHFSSDTPPDLIADKAVTVNVSDIAAMGAEPRWLTLALTIPQVDQTWLNDFRCGLQRAMQRYHVNLIGGDLTRGPLSITIQAQGLIPRGQALRRNGAQAGDHIFVSGTLGDAGLGLAILTQQLTDPISEQAFCIERLHCPSARIALGVALRGIATSCIDISDGLAQDLQHILTASAVGATVDVSALPLSFALQSLPPEYARQLALSAGDDYELCFTVPADKVPLLQQISQTIDYPLTCIGNITVDRQLVFLADGQLWNVIDKGFKHF